MPHVRAPWGVLAIAVLMLAACASTSEPGTRSSSEDFVGHRWRVTIVQHGQSRFVIPAALGAWVEFKSNGQLGAYNGVNGYGATFKRTKHGYRLGDDAVGSAVGNPGPGAAPPSTLAVIDAMDPMTVGGADVSASVKSGQLQLGAHGYQITGTPMTPTGPATASLVNTQWRLISITQHGRTTTVPAGVHPTIGFDDAGKARGNDGCNMFGTSVTLNGSAISFSGGAVTDMRCADQVDTIERQYMNALALVNQWSTSNGTLRLMGPEDLRLIFNVD
jgi:heat shock protein HslJ